ncbi:hypothetical protein AKJ41_03950 [candidate division MSBL1 archaeon SCGC-AAA259O05]|uniref:Uncharacterized protein n=1 Tax=candidate division MSBL1 archaeon SCGC-AAA259O05 TaxID=1698271 RepID=A0A133V2A4_9EURY|nr:hypothetical protein AKJ41_03950 [candidate division MSBL1 archaeon SCGC-AAA259O05]
MRAGSDAGKAETELNPESEPLEELDVVEPSRAMYNLEFLQFRLANVNEKTKPILSKFGLKKYLPE